MICGIVIFSLLRGTPWNGGTFVSIPTESPQQEMMNDDAECACKIKKIQNTEYRNTDCRIQKCKSKESPYKLMIIDDAVSILTEEAAASLALFQMLNGLIFDQIDLFQHSAESGFSPQEQSHPDPQL